MLILSVLSVFPDLNWMPSVLTPGERGGLRASVTLALMANAFIIFNKTSIKYIIVPILV